MRNKLRKNKMVMIGLCSVLLLMIVGYAAFSTSLKISGISKITSTWDVEITDIQVDEIIGDAENVSGPSHDKLSAWFDVDFKSPGDGIIYAIEVSNLGNIDAILKKINMNISNSDWIEDSVSGILAGETLAKGKSVILYVRLSFVSDLTTMPDDLSTDINIDLEFEQAN